MPKALNKDHIKRRAAFSRCKRYRYRLERSWNQDTAAKRVVFVGLNPSTADHRVDDPTIRRCIDFSHRWGYNAVTVINLFAYRTPYPAELKKADNPIGPYNRSHCKAVIEDAELVIACWGRYGNWFDQDLAFASWVDTPLQCLSVNRDGSPAHPLYIRADTKPCRWAPKNLALS